MFTKGFVLIQSIGEYSDRTETTLAFSENENELKEKQIQLQNETEQRLLHFEKSKNDIKSYFDKYYREIDDQWDYNQRKIWFVENPVPEEIDDFIWISDSENDSDLKSNSEKFIELQQTWESDLYVSYHIQSFGNDSKNFNQYSASIFSKYFCKAALLKFNNKSSFLWKISQSITGL